MAAVAHAAAASVAIQAPVFPADRWVRRTTTASVLLLAGIAAVVSYGHMHALALGVPGRAASPMTCYLTVPLLTTFRLPLGYRGDILGGGFILSLVSFLVAVAALETGSPYAQLGASWRSGWGTGSHPAACFPLAGGGVLADMVKKSRDHHDSKYRSGCPYMPGSRSVPFAGAAGAVAPWGL